MFSVFSLEISFTLLWFPSSFETYTDDKYTFPRICEHHDSFLYYIKTRLLNETPDEPILHYLLTETLILKKISGKITLPTYILIAADFIASRARNPLSNMLFKTFRYQSLPPTPKSSNFQNAKISQSSFC